MKKIKYFIGIILCMVLIFTACDQKTKNVTETKENTTETSETKTISEKSALETKEPEKEKEIIVSRGKVKVAHLVNGFLGDKSFHDSAERGLSNLKAQLKDDFEYKTVEMTDDTTKHLPTLYEYAESGDWDIIIVGTWQMVEPLMEVAEAHPKQKFIIYDDALDYTGGKYGNVYSVKFKQNEGSYLAGYLAAKLSSIEGDPRIDPTESKIGFLGGMSNPVINDFLVGYIQGAVAADTKVKVVVSYINDFFDAPKGKSLALVQYQNDGVDVGFNVASLAGLGQLDAALEANKYAIGVDSDQAELVGEPRSAHIPTSMLKNVDKSIERAIRLYKNGELKFGEEEVLGIKEGAVGLIKNDNYKKIVPENIQMEIEEIEKRLIAGELEVQTAFGKSNEDIEKIIESVK